MRSKKRAKEHALWSVFEGKVDVDTRLADEGDDPTGQDVSPEAGARRHR